MKDYDDNNYDFVIVGAGSEGCVLARRLVEDTAARVLLLEAGQSDEGVPSISDPPRWTENLGSVRDWNYSYEPTERVNGRRIRLARGKVLGGSGSINALIWARGNRAVYDGWAEAGNAGWDYESLLPLFKKTEDWEEGASEFRGAGGPIGVERAQPLHPVGRALIEAGQAYGMPLLSDINVPEPVGVGPMNLTKRDGVRSSSASGYLRPVMHHERLTVLTGVQVLHLRFLGSRCTGLDYLKDGKTASVRSAQEVVLSAGTIDTPRLLMLSGVGPQDELRRLGIPVVADLPGVGQNLQDHPFLTCLCFEAKEPLTPLTNNLGDATFFWKSRPDLRSPDLMFIGGQIPVITPEIAAQYPVPKNAFSLLPALVRVESRGHLRMMTARHDGPLEIQPNLLAEPADIEALLTALELGFDIAAQPAYRKLIKRWVAPEERLSRPALLGFLRDSCATYWHPVGTCAMGSGREAVVDDRLLVHGIEGLRIADASIMPTIPAANTNAAAIMIGEFASRQITAQQVTVRRTDASPAAPRELRHV